MRGRMTERKKYISKMKDVPTEKESFKTTNGSNGIPRWLWFSW